MSTNGWNGQLSVPDFTGSCRHGPTASLTEQLPPSEREMGGGSTEEPQSSSRPSSRDQSSRRIACDICRGRKVRCDRVHPVCGRCRKLGHKCGYTAHRKPSDAVKPNISQALITLHERLAQTEAQLALTQRAIPHIGPARNLSRRVSIEPPEIQVSSSGIVSPRELNFHQYDPFKNYDTQQQSLIDQAFDMWHQPGFDFDSIIAPSDGFDYSYDVLESSSFPSLVPSISTDVTGGDLDPVSENTSMHVYHQSYFSYIHGAIPMMNRRRFFSDLKTSGHRPEMKSLSHAVALLGSTVNTDQTEVEQNFYQRARKYLSIAEADDEAPGFNFLNMLQAVILIAYYEFRRTSFSRAWLSLGRANRLAKMLGLHTMDQDDHLRDKSSFVTPLPEAVGLAELEERRRSFWVLFTFDSYASVRTGSSSSMEGDEIITYLPCPGDYSEKDLAVKMPILSQAATISDKTLLSSFSGVILMANLYRRCHNHYLASQKQDSTGDMKYGFWQYHYQLDKELSFHVNQLLDHVQPVHQTSDPLALNLHANLSAIQITLHEHAIQKVQKDGLPDLLRVESQNRCTSIAIQVATYANKSISQLQTSKDCQFISNPFLIWPFSVASKVILRHLKEPISNVGEVAALLHQMWCIMRRIKDESGTLEALLETIARELAQLGILVASDSPAAVAVIHAGIVGGLEMDPLEGLSGEEMQQ